MKPIAAVLEQHVEEAAFLWLLREGAVHAPHYARKDLAKLDLRLEAHLDALRIAGPHGWSALKEALALEEPGEIFTAALLAFESGDVRRSDLVLDAGTATPELSRGLISAIGWLAPKKADRLIKALLASPSRLRRRIGVGGAAIRRLDFEKEFLAAAQDEDSLLRARALRAIAELGFARHGPLFSRELKAADPAVGYSAAWGAALLSGDPEGVWALQEFAAGPDRKAREALVVAMRRMTPAAASVWREKLSANPHTLRQAVIGAGASGDPAAIPWLLSQAARPAVARVAGEALSMITGVDLAEQDLEGPPPEGFDVGPGDDPQDENVLPDPDGDLPWPRVRMVGAWWESRKSFFASGKRYLAGREVSAGAVREVLAGGLQRQRAAAAVELVVLERNTPLVEVRSPAFRS
jgi:uncharacterized protein (TIGR02270 family)